MTEQIELKVAKSGTTVQFFDTHLEPDGVSTFRAYIIFNQNNQPIQIGTFEAEPFYRDQNNHMVLVSSLGLPYLTGSTKTQDLSYILSDIQKTRISNRWAQSMALTFSGQSRSYTMFSDTMVNDMFINVSLHRSSSSLDTLNVYNNLVNSFPAQESTTGTLFGRLIATQKIVDTNGNNIHIPLKNVPIGIFNPTEEFPSPASTDDDGNRITLNLKEYSPASLYFNEQSYSADTGSYLHSGYAFTAVPAFYKYVTTTNDEGEFVLHNVPTGTQTIFFEVDLFKQGLTQDEIALNFFPFPADNEPNISSYPHLFFRQFQVDIIPTWGTLQTGYTETNISVALDLRKWATYFVEQISFNNLDFDALLMKGITTPLTISIRNMAQEGFPVGNTEVVEIVDMIDRDLNHVMLWRNEFKQLKSKAQFYVDGYHAFKLPANMYDPVGTKTDKNGFPTDSKGVWLAGYQLSMYYSDKSVLFRNTGSSKIRLDDGTYVTRDHYNLNKSNTDITQQNASAPPSNGDFPYERKWDHMYPEPYSIPSIPVEPNPQFDVLNDQGKRIVERPRFIDGDIVGKPFHSFLDPDNLYGGTGGYGVAVDETDNEWFKTDFSKAVTKNYVYRYENTEDPNSKYATGYMPNSQDFPLQPGISSVKKGEKYQRLECGYSYWLRPEGWPRVAHYPENGGSEAVYDMDTKHPHELVTPAITNGSSQSVHTVFTYETAFQYLSTPAGKKMFLDLGSNTNMKEGGIDIYRVVDPSPQNVNLSVINIIETFTDYYFGTFFFQRGQDWTTRLKMFIQNSGSGGGHKFWSNGGPGWDLSMSEMKLKLTNEGSLTVDVLGRRMAPGTSATFFAGEISDASSTFEGAIMRLPGNYNFDYDTFRYTESRYGFEFQNIKLYNGEGGFLGGQATQEGPSHSRTLFTYTRSAGPSSNPGKAYLRSYLTNVNTYCDDKSTVIVGGMAFPNPQQGGGRSDPFWGARFWESPVGISCGVGVAYRDASNGE